MITYLSRIKATIVLAVLSLSAAQAQTADSTAEVRHARMRHIKEHVANVKSLPRKERKRYIKHVADSILDTRNKITTDTNYVARPTSDWNIRFKTNLYGNFIHVSGINASGQEQEYHLDTNVKCTVGATVIYRGISLSLALSPTKIIGRSSDKEYNINYYGRQFGADLQYSDIHALYVKDVVSGGSHIRIDGGRLHSISANGYWIFNPRKFSYPAAFNNTWIQKRSAGTWLAGLSFYVGQLSCDDDFRLQQIYTQAVRMLNMAQISIGGGYAYNYVPSRHWLIHVSAQPDVLVWKKYTLYTADTTTGEEFSNRMSTRFPEAFLLGRVGVTYSWGRYYLGAHAMMQTTVIGPNTNFHMRNTKWKARAYFGIRM